MAIAVERGGVLVTDDSAALRVLQRLRPQHPYERVRRLLLRAAAEGRVGLDGGRPCNVVEVGTRAWAEQRLDELEEDEDGWFDGAGKAATAPAVTAARALLERLEEAAMPPYPRFSPTTEGAVEALWEHETRVLNLEIQPDGRTYLLAFDLDTRETFQDREDEALKVSMVVETWRALVASVE